MKATTLTPARTADWGMGSARREDEPQSSNQGEEAWENPCEPPAPRSQGRAPRDASR
jgi:hypothetical protein